MNQFSNHSGTETIDVIRLKCFGPQEGSDLKKEDSAIQPLERVA